MLVSLRIKDKYIKKGREKSIRKRKTKGINMID